MTKWRSRSAHSRADISFFIFIIFFAVFGIIVLTELLFLERRNEPGDFHLRFYEDLQAFEKVESANTAMPPPAREPLDGQWQAVGGTSQLDRLASEKSALNWVETSVNTDPVTRYLLDWVAELASYPSCKPSEVDARHCHFQANFRYRFFVFSAFVERRTTLAIRVIGATKTRGADTVFCRIWLRNNSTVEVKAKVQSIRENWNMKFSAVFVLCPLSGAGVRAEEAADATVAVVAEDARSKPPTNLLIVHDTEPKSGIEKNIHVCVKPFHYNFGRDEWLIEWLEVNRLLGVNYFYMYNKTLSNSTNCILESYIKQGLIKMFPWQLPIMSKIEIRTEGQFVAFNDCLYRAMSNASWLLVIDVDEVMFPKQEDTLLEMLNSLGNSNEPPNAQPAAFLFRNAFFYVLWEDDPQAPAPLLTARKTRRWATPHGIKTRSKCALRPYGIVELGNHFVWEHAPGHTSVGVRVDRAILHHYRQVCEFGGSKCLSVQSMVDRTAHKWSKELMKKIEEQRKLLSDTCLAYMKAQLTETPHPAMPVYDPAPRDNIPL